MLNAGWHAHTLNAPGKFLISAPEHDTPRRARAYLVTDQDVTDTAALLRGKPSATGRGVPARDPARERPVRRLGRRRLRPERG